MLLSPSTNLKEEIGKKLFMWWNQGTPFGALRRSITSRSPISRPGITWMRQIESIPRTDLNCGWKRSNLHPKLNTPPPLRILYFSLLYNHSIKKETNAPCRRAPSNHENWFPSIPSPFDGGGWGWGWTSRFCPPSPQSSPTEGRGGIWGAIFYIILVKKNLASLIFKRNIFLTEIGI